MKLSAISRNIAVYEQQIQANLDSASVFADVPSETDRLAKLNIYMDKRPIKIDPNLFQRLLTMMPDVNEVLG